MRRKDGKPKLAARRNHPEYSYGFANHPDNLNTVNSAWMGRPAENSHSIVSFFAGCGGLDLGMLGGFKCFGREFRSLPYVISYAIDNSRDAVDCYRLNLGNHIELGDLTEVNYSDIPSADILIGGFPCQDFSSSGTKTGFAGERGTLYQTMIRYMNIYRPKLVVGENVAHLGRLAAGAYLKQILADIKTEGYKAAVWDLYGPDFGLPQSRRRLFIVGVRDDLPGFPHQPKPSHLGRYFTVDDALRDLEDISDESICNQSQFFVATKATSGGGQGDHQNRRGEVAYCIRANARGRIQFHYNLPRRLTVRECARLQSFPDSFVFPYTTQRNLTLIGNAVAPLIGHCIGESLRHYLENASSAEPSSDDSCACPIAEQTELSLAA
jgi:DNA (cytosine-5)-methyltransferase 1